MSYVTDAEDAQPYSGEEFQAPDFVVSTANAMVIDVPAASFSTSSQEVAPTRQAELCHYVPLQYNRRFEDKEKIFFFMFHLEFPKFHF